MSGVYVWMASASRTDEGWVMMMAATYVFIKIVEANNSQIALILDAQRGKKVANKEKAKAERIAKQKSWGSTVKRVQRYIGLREKRAEGSCEPDGGVFASFILAPFPMEQDVVFISVDAEAYKRDQSKVTEIGVSTVCSPWVMSCVQSFISDSALRDSVLNRNMLTCNAP